VYYLYDFDSEQVGYRSERERTTNLHESVNVV